MTQAGTSPGPPPLADTGELGTWLGEGVPDDQDDRATYLLRIASARARRRCGQNWTDPNNPTALLGVPDEVAGVVVQAAARAYLNPEGYTAEGDADYTMQRGGDRNEAGNVYFTPDEERTLDAYAASPRRSGLFTISTTRTDTDCAASYAETDPYQQGWPST